MLARMPRLLLAIFALLLLAAPASAAPSFSVGQGQDPDLVIDDTGTARIAWIQESGPEGALRIRGCKLPRGATACEGGVRTLPVPPDLNVRELQVLANGATVAVVISASSGWYVTTSTSDGPFTAWKAGGDEELADGNALLGPGANRVSVANPGTFQTWATSAAKTTTEVELTPTFPTPTYSGAGLDPDTGRPVVVAADGDNAEFFRYDAPSPYSTGGLQNRSNWSGPTAVGSFGDVPRLASGKSGLFMLMNTEVGAGFANQVQVRRFNGAGFGPAVDVGPRAPAYEYDLFVHPSTGSLFAAWRFNDNPTARLVVSRSADGGATWSAATVTRANNELNSVGAIEVAAAPDGQGLTVFEDAGVGSTNDHDVRAATLDPLPDPVTPTNPGGTGGGPQPQPQPQQPQPPLIPEDPAASNSFGTVKVGDFRFELFAPSACVPANANVRLKVGYKEKRKVVRGKKRRSRYRLSKAVFSVVGLKKTDKKKPLRVKFPAAPFVRGQDIPVRVKVTLKRRKGVKGGKKTLKKTLKGSFRIC